jgi:hypothetical protein
LFKSADAEGLRQLQLHASDSVAIQAAWEEVELTVPTQPVGMVRPDRDKLARFLGFLEGRGRVRAPPWWAEALLDARANRRGNVYSGGLNVAGQREGGPKAAAPPRPAAFDMRDGKPVVRVGTIAALIPENLLEKLGWEQSDRVSALITPARCYVAVHGSAGHSYRLACVERPAATVRWVTRVWGSYWGSTTGIHFQWVEVTVQGNRVVVFGVASVGFNAEAFRVEDGANVFRFSNGYSGR